MPNTAESDGLLMQKDSASYHHADPGLKLLY